MSICHYTDMALIRADLTVCSVQNKDILTLEKLFNNIN